jgi:hypothetical protein
MRETSKVVEIGDRKFQIGKFDALTGSYVIYTLLTQILPMGLGAKIEGLPTNSNSKPPEGDNNQSDMGFLKDLKIPLMSKETFVELQKDCLRVCSEIKPTGDIVAPMPVLMADGRWGVEDLQKDAPTVMALTIQVLGYNVQDFFGGNALENFKESISKLNSSNA